MKARRDCDWRGARELRWRFKGWGMRREVGRMCYRTDCMGNTVASWWEWEVV